MKKILPKSLEIAEISLQDRHYSRGSDLSIEIGNALKKVVKSFLSVFFIFFIVLFAVFLMDEGFRHEIFVCILVSSACSFALTVFPGCFFVLSAAELEVKYETRLTLRNRSTEGDLKKMCKLDSQWMKSLVEIAKIEKELKETESSYPLRSEFADLKAKFIANTEELLLDSQEASAIEKKKDLSKVLSRMSDLKKSL